MRDHPGMRMLDQRRFRVMQVYVLLTPILIIPGLGARYFGIADLMLPITVVLLMAGGSKLKVGHVAFGFFAIAAAISTLWLSTVSPTYDTSGILALVRAFACLVPFFMAQRMGSFSNSMAERLIATFYISGLGALAVAIFMFVFGIQGREEQQRLWYDTGESGLRAGGLLGNSSDLGHLAAILATVSVAFAIHFGRHALLAAVMFAISMYVTYVSSSRAAALHILVFCAFLLPVFFARRKLRVLVTSAAVLLVTLVLAFESFGFSAAWASTFRNRFDFLNVGGQTMFFESATRLGTWAEMTSLVGRAPFVGYGYNSTLGLVGQAGDNSFLSMLFEVGLVGGAAYAFFWVSLVLSASRARLRTDRLVGLGLVLGEIVHLLTLDGHRMWSSMPLIMLFLGVWLRLTDTRFQSPSTDAPGRSTRNRRPASNAGSRSRGWVG